jgi:hypothetical protein
MRLIGDVHGKYKQYHRIIKECDSSIQVGDMGVGFRYHGQSAMKHGEPCENPRHSLMVKQNARFIRGNHDNPTVCKNHSQWIPDGHIEIINNQKFMFVGGATSIDIYSRLEGYSWWADEELNISSLYDMVNLYLNEKPDVMVTHECPEFVTAMMLATWKLDKKSATRQCFESMIEMHSPSAWFYGHYHMPFKLNYKNCEFQCLAELE